MDNNNEERMSQTHAPHTCHTIFKNKTKIKQDGEREKEKRKKSCEPNDVFMILFLMVFCNSQPIPHIHLNGFIFRMNCTNVQFN